MAKSKSKVDVSKTYESLLVTANGAAEDVVKFAAGNATAGSRVRKAMQEVKMLARQLRLEVQAIKNA